jgi:hypothetical protein
MKIFFNIQMLFREKIVCTVLARKFNSYYKFLKIKLHQRAVMYKIISTENFKVKKLCGRVKS